MFLQELGKIEAEAFLTLASEMIEDDGIVTVEEDQLMEQYVAQRAALGYDMMMEEENKQMQENKRRLGMTQ